MEDDVPAPSSASGRSMNRNVSVPYDVLREFLIAEIDEWFAERGLDSDVLMALYNEDNEEEDELDDYDSEDKPTQKLGQRLDRRSRTSKWKWINRWHKLQLFPRFEYDGARVDKVIGFLIQSQREAWHTNPYNLSSIYYIIVFFALVTWAFGTVVCAHFEAVAKIKNGDHHGHIAVLLRGSLGAIPALVQITLWLFPPLWVSF